LQIAGKKGLSESTTGKKERTFSGEKGKTKSGEKKCKKKNKDIQWVEKDGRGRDRRRDGK